MQQTHLPYSLIGATTESLSISVVFCLNENNPFSMLYLSHFVELCHAQKITYKVILFTPTTVDACITFLQHKPCTFIVCLDNNYLPALMQAHTKLFLAAPVICVDWAAPTENPAPITQKCFIISTPITFFAQQLCNFIVNLPTVQKICILFCPQDQLFVSLLPSIEGWLTTRNYEYKKIERMPSITGNDVILFSQFDLIIFLCRNTPDDYMTRLATVCREQHTILYVTNPVSIAHGAPCAFGPHLKQMAQMTLHVMREYLATGMYINPTLVEYELIINKYEVAQNPIFLASLESFMTLAEKTTVITPTTSDKVSAYLRLEQVPLE